MFKLFRHLALIAFALVGWCPNGWEIPDPCWRTDRGLTYTLRTDEAFTGNDRKRHGAGIFFTVWDGDGQPQLEYEFLTVLDLIVLLVSGPEEDGS